MAIATAQEARRLLIEQHLPLVRTIARRFAHRGESLEDLVQVGAVGLIKAVDRFDRAARRDAGGVRRADDRRRDPAAPA